MNRSGVFFSMLSFFIVAIILAGAMMKTAEVESANAGIHEHVLAANHFILQLEEDLPRALYITGYRGLLGLEEYVSDTGSYIDNLSVAFTEVITNGTVNGTAYEIMDDTTLDDFTQRMMQISDEVGLDLELAITNVSLGHTSPFEIQVNTTLHVNLTSADGSTSWSYSTQVSSTFPTDDLKDPLWTVGTLSRVPATITRSNVTRPYITASNDTTRLQTLLNYTMYIEDPSGPSLLMRFTGNLSASPFGIASLVDTKDLDSQDLVVLTDRSVVDHLYFGSGPTTTNTIVNMSSQFLLDDDHLALYDAVGKTT